VATATAIVSVFVIAFVIAFVIPYKLAHKKLFDYKKYWNIRKGPISRFQVHLGYCTIRQYY